LGQARNGTDGSVVGSAESAKACRRNPGGIVVSGCYGNDPYDKWLESQQDKYWSEILVDEQEPSEVELREAAAEADREAREGK
jgi:hypothetical protein